MRKQRYSTWLVVLLVVLIVSCGSEERQRVVMDRVAPSYLEDIIPPCTIDSLAIIGGEDPCSVADPIQIEMVSTMAAFPIWPVQGNLPTMTDVLLGISLVSGKYWPSLAAHVVVRGIAKPGTTRCDAYPMFRPEREKINEIYEGLFHYHCFTDILIHEYIIGSGPSNLTVSMHRENLWDLDTDDWPRKYEDIAEKNLQNPRQRTAEIYEGKELILFLGSPSTIAVETWTPAGPFNLWFVQRHGDIIRAVSHDILYALTVEQRNWLDRPLDALTRDIKQASKNRITLTEGRTGIESHHPLLVTDANYLQTYYKEIGAVYDNSEDKTVLPPPVPGEGDPVPVTVPVNEGEITVVSSVPVPGEEVTVPPSDDAGLTVGQESTTTTVVDTSTTSTTVVEPPVTTEVVPAVTTTSEVVENTTTTTIADTITVTGTTTTTVAPVVTTVVSGGEDGAPLTEDGVPGEDQVSTTTSLVQSQSTTTTTGGEDSVPLTEDGVPGEDQVSTTTSLVQSQPTTSSSTTTLLDGDDIGPGEDSGIVPPVDDGNEEEGQVGTGLSVDDG